MKRSFKRARMLAVAVVGACALMAASASAASAANAWWVNTGGVTASGSLTLKQAGANEKTCTPATGIGGSAVNTENGGEKVGSLALQNNAFGQVQYNCTGSTWLTIEILGFGSYESGLWLTTLTTPELHSPYGNYHEATWKVPWTNGVEGGSSSSFAFSNTIIGSNAGGNITATGTTTVKRVTSGAVLTLTH
jgi:hypothetical protein